MLEQVGDAVLQIAAQDADEGLNALLAYTITTGNDLGFFFLDNDAVLRVQKPPDGSVRDEHTLTIQAADQGNPPLAETVEVTVSVVHFPPPQFAQGQQAIQVTESTPTQHALINLSATPLHDGTDRRIEYSIEEVLRRAVAGTTELTPNHFSVDSATGMLSLAELLDRERELGYVVTVRGTDFGSPRKWSLATVELSVIDVNDNQPAFQPNAVTLSLREETPIGAVVFDANGTDPDIGANALLTYGLACSDACLQLLTVDEMTGVMTLTASLQDFVGDRLSVNITASDAGTPRLTGILAVTIAVVRFGAPLFGAASYTGEVAEDATSGVVTMVTASPQHDLVDKSIDYAIIGGNVAGAFRIRPDGAIEIARQLDREAVPFYTITVEAIDHGPLRKANTIVVTVTVLDVNDNDPAADSIVASVRESAVVGDEVAIVVGRDADAGENQRLSYTITGGNTNGSFSIDGEDGKIRVATPLIGAELDHYILEVR